MRAGNICNMSSASLMGLAIGMVAGISAGLLAAPMRGTAMRATLRQRAADSSARLSSLIEQGRRALSTGSHASQPTTLTATLHEVASMQGGAQLTNMGVLP